MTLTVAPVPETPEDVYDILCAHKDDQRFLRNAFFKAHCPGLPQFVRFPEDLAKAGLTRDDRMPDHIADVVKACVEDDLDFQMRLTPLATYYN
ncbi:MAG TPA: hypothetical protein PKX87_08675, partial [Alphaproteobacteria bacterium]|nr:hypothetical protein [Alphaproteobacteria bacterium]